MRIYEFVSLRECVGRLDEPNLTCAHSSPYELDASENKFIG